MKKWILVLIAAIVVGVTFGLKKKTNNQTETQKRIFHLYAMSEYFPASVLKDFEQKHNVEVRYDNFASNEELLAKLQAGATGYDLIVPSDYMVRSLIGSNLLLPLDLTQIPNSKSLAAEFQNSPYDPGNKHSIPYTWGTTGLIYNSKHVKPKKESWDLVFQKEYAGHISMLDDVREVMSAMLRSEGQSANTTDDGKLKLAQQKLKKLKSNVRLFSSDPRQHLISEDIWIAHIYSGDANQLTREHPELKYFVPSEGGVIWIDTLAIPKTAPNPDLAHAFINLILDKEVAKTISDELLYASPNAAAEPLLANDLKPSQIKKLKKGQLEFLEDLGPANEKLDQLWTEAKTL